MMIRTYSELQRIPSFQERYDYLRLTGVVGRSTFGFDRYLNQLLYQSARWKQVRNVVILRDEACDLGDTDYEIHDKIIIHHMNPLTVQDIELDNADIYNPEFLITTSTRTHNAIHFGDATQLPKDHVPRRRGDTQLW